MKDPATDHLRIRHCYSLTDNYTKLTKTLRLVFRLVSSENVGSKCLYISSFQMVVHKPQTTNHNFTKCVMIKTSRLLANYRYPDSLTELGMASFESCREDISGATRFDSAKKLSQ